MLNHRLTLSEAIEGYRINAEARNLSKHTLKDYFTTFRRFADFVGSETRVTDLTKRDIRGFMRSLNGLSGKTKLNHHIALSALWTWMVNEELVMTHIVRQVKAPKVERKAVDPFTKQDVTLMLAEIDKSGVYRLRDRAIVLTLLDTGLRASELCGLTFKDADLRNRRLRVMGKGLKERVVAISPGTAKAIWRYRATRDETDPTDPVFANTNDLPLTRSGLLQLVRRIGNRAGVPGAHPHRFRHTFAINYLRNGGNPYALQHILGHSSMRMVSRYIKIARADIDMWHKAASPVANWKLG